MKYAIIAAALYLLLIGSIMETKNLRSAVLFKAIPIGLSFALGIAACQMF